jgi:uncharacterized protein (TIGR02099 family)
VFSINLYKHELETKLSELVESPVTIGYLSAKMYRLYPEISLKNVSLLNNNQQTNITLKEVHLGFDLTEMLLTGQLIAATHIRLIGAKLSVIRQQDGRFSVVGLKAGDGQPLWLLQGKNYQLLDSEISWLDKKRQGKKVTFKQVDLVIKNDVGENRHQIHFLSQLPSFYGKKLRVSVDIQGNVFEPDNLNGRIFIAGENIQFSKLFTGELPLKLILKQGMGDFKFWGEIQQSELKALMGRINTQKLTLQRSDAKKLKFNALKGKFNWINQDNSWHLDIEDLIYQDHKKNSQASTFSLKITNLNHPKLAAQIKQLDLRFLNRLYQFFTPLITKSIEPIDKFSISGELSKGLLFADIEQQHYALKAGFKQLSIKDASGFQSISNLSGSILGNNEQGYLTLNSSNLRLHSKTSFRRPLKISQLTGNIHWLQSCDDWVINSNFLRLETPDFQTENKFILKIPKTKQPTFIDLQTAFYEIKDVSQLKRYFPINSMGKETIAWLDNAFISGSIKRGDFTLYGDLVDFPFKKHQGVFQVLFTTHDLNLHYAENWPNFKGVNADVMFLNEGLEVNVHHAKAGKININKVSATIPSLEKSDYLSAKVEAQGKIIDSLNWLQQTPLNLSTNKILEQLAIKGENDIRVDLKIPLTDKGAEYVKGQVKFKRASAKVRALELPITAIKGTLNFDEQHFYTDKLRAVTLGSAIHINLKDNAKTIELKVKGKVSIKALQQQFKLDNLTFAKGNTAYQLQLNLPMNDNQDAKLKLSSDLVGISLKLPKILAKKRDEKKSFLVKLAINSKPLLLASIFYNQNLTFKLKFNKQSKKLQAANVLLGQGKVNFPSQKGVNVQLNQPNFYPLAWLDFINNQPNKRNSSLLTRIDIKTPAFNWKNKNFGAFSLNLTREKNNWRGFIDSRFGIGKINLPITGIGKYRLDMEMINLSELAKIETTKKDNNTDSRKKIIPIDIQSKQLIWRGINLGKLSLSSHRKGQGLYFDSIALLGKNYNLALTADWNNENNQSQTHLQGQLKTNEFGELLKKLNFTDDLKETIAKINVDLNWQGAPYQFSLAALNGKVKLNLTEGRISSIEPGFGRLLGVLAMKQWIKRLQLDFDDIYKEGLSFNSIQGHYNLQNGKAYSDNLIVDAIPAEIFLKGEIDLRLQQLDKEISVVPKSSAALPIAGTIVGGIATVIAQTVTGEYEEGFYLRTKYQLQGKWDKLKVTPLHEQDGLLPKIGRGLTDFSWIVD